MLTPRGIPETRYVAVGDADVAYRFVGDGPLDLLHFYGAAVIVTSPRLSG